MRKRKENGQGNVLCLSHSSSLPGVDEHLVDNSGIKNKHGYTSKMIPLRTSFESTPTFRSSRHSLSNFSGVSLLSMLENKKERTREQQHNESLNDYAKSTYWHDLMLSGGSLRHSNHVNKN